MLKSKKRNTFEKVIMIMIFFFFDIVLTGLMGSVQTQAISLGYVVNNAFRLLVAGVILYIMIVEYGRELKFENLRQFVYSWKLKLSNWYIIIAGIVAMIGFQVLVSLLIPSGQTSANEAGLNEIIANTNFLFPIFVMFVGPIVEEFIFRGLFFNIFFKKNTKLNNIVGILINGLLFGLMHETELSLYLLIYSVMGMILAAVYLFTKDIKSSIIVHMVNNIISSL